MKRGREFHRKRRMADLKLRTSEQFRSVKMRRGFYTVADSNVMRDER